ncbi:hypothetical protein [Duganella sp. P38]|uniref:hypothetical protein n=1 Tax=Duganella sp. P38 TaxID=3423949 RepID=UPI003D78DED8
MDTNDKDYIDARLQALSAQVRASEVATNARLEQFNQTLEFGLKSTIKEQSLMQAQVEATLERIARDVTRSQSEIIKWVAGISIASAAFSISATALLVTHLGPQNNAPIVVYAQPAPAAAPLKATP